MFEEAKMNLREWILNNETVNQTFDIRDRIKKIKVKVLGINVDFQEDVFEMKLTKIDETKPITKRQILKTIARCFDPLGLLLRCLTEAKTLLRQLWLDNYEWDEIIEETYQKCWKMIIKEFSSLSMKIPRKITGTSNAIYQIVGFNDASQLHFTANIYLRTIENNKAFMKLIFAKLRTKKNSRFQEWNFWD
uniref:Uncharacterized protein n=1 Tax=Acrobeloides nanus TaxID=290746 RepID=A0A914CZA3_9BILA